MLRRSLLRLAGSGIRLALEASPSAVAFVAILQIAQAALTVLLIVEMQHLAQLIIEQVRGQVSVGQLVAPGTAFLATGMAQSVLALLSSDRQALLGELAGKRAELEILRIASGVRYEEFERSEFYDRLERAQLRKAPGNGAFLCPDVSPVTTCRQRSVPRAADDSEAARRCATRATRRGNGRAGACARAHRRSGSRARDGARRTRAGAL